MNNPERRAVARRGHIAERHANDLASARGVEYAQGCGCNRNRAKPLLEFESHQSLAGRVGRELDAGAGLFEPLRLFDHDNAEAVARKRQRGGQSADPGT